ncbi:MAG: hypothetical protein ACH350_05085 [Parachlamydiaceae bacterium]
MPSVANNKGSASSNHHDIGFWRELTVDATSGFIAGSACFVFEGLKKRGQRNEIQFLDYYRLSNGNLFRVLHPREALRGVSSFAGAVALNAASGMTFTKCLRDLSFYDKTSEKHKVGTAIVGGMFGAIFSTCAENTIVVQQEHKMGPVQAWRHMLKQGARRPFVGLRELMMREAGFIGSILYFGPRARELTVEKTESQALGWLSAIGVGATFAVATHPADTLATWRQKKEGKLSFIGGVKELYGQGGLNPFFRGVGSRICLFTGCFLILESLPQEINKRIDRLIEKT